ncbi:MAG: hypothetical protein ABIM99_05150 [Candidatus Dojkabacteria bacterium]
MDNFQEPSGKQVKMPDLVVVKEYIITFFQAFDNEQIKKFFFYNGVYWVKSNVNTSQLMRDMVMISADQIDGILSARGLYEYFHPEIEPVAEVQTEQ